MKESLDTPKVFPSALIPHPPSLLMSWSGGKDSALALNEILKGGGRRVASLVTTLTEGEERVPIQNVPRELIERQAEALGLPLRLVHLSKHAPNAEYEQKLSGALEEFRAAGVEEVAFGDIFLEDVRAYREALLKRAGLRGLFPLWGRETGALAREFVASGFRAVVTSVDARRLDASFVGREFDEKFLAALPAGVDACGENGEFHTFVSDGPIFRRPVAFNFGEVA